MRDENYAVDEWQPAGTPTVRIPLKAGHTYRITINPADTTPEPARPYPNRATRRAATRKKGNPA